MSTFAQREWPTACSLYEYIRQVDQYAINVCASVCTNPAACSAHVQFAGDTKENLSHDCLFQNGINEFGVKRHDTYIVCLFVCDTSHLGRLFAFFHPLPLKYGHGALIFILFFLA